MPKPRIWYRYDYKIKRKIRHSGITKDPERRETEHRGRWPGGNLKVVGPAVTKDTALKWEETKKKTITPKRKPKK